MTPAVREHLSSNDGHRVEILPYNSVTDRITQYVQKYPEGKIWMSGTGTSMALVNCVPEDRLYDKTSPAVVPKAMKNPVELKGMRNSHVRATFFNLND